MATRFRVHIVASDLGLSDEQVLLLCADLGIEADAPSSSLEESDVRRIKRKITRAKIEKIEEAEREKRGVAARKKTEIESKKKAVAEESKRILGEKKRKAAEKKKAADRKNREAEARKKAAAEKKRREEKEKRRTEEEKKRTEEGAKKKAEEAIMREEARKAAAEEMRKKEAAEKKKREAELKRKKAEELKKERERRKAEEKAQRERIRMVKERMRIVELDKLITLKSLAPWFGLKPGEMTEKLKALGMKVAQSTRLDKETIEIFAEELGYEIIFTGKEATGADEEKARAVEARVMEEVEKEARAEEARQEVERKLAEQKKEEEAAAIKKKAEKKEKPFAVEEEVETEEFEEEEDEPDDPKDLKPRPPVVTVMGHVDHGKTSILDYIRKSKVAEREKGGITQHIGAYKITHHGHDIVFIDTPGHEAFTEMRARGAKVTDIVVLVVAADDGIMPQTVEAMNHARSAEAPMIVAINKIDKPNATPDETKRQLMQYNLLPEDWGGETIVCNISALNGTGIDHLLEMITLQAEIMELKANPDRQMRGVVIESKISKGRGAVVSIIVKKGTLKVGDVVFCGTSFGKVKAIMDENGKRLKSAGPATPAEIMGLSDPPLAGETIRQVDNERQAREYVERRIENERRSAARQTEAATFSLEDLLKSPDEEAKELRVVLKGDVQGSVEALAASLEKVGTEKARVNILHSAVGPVGESDVMLAKASQAVIIAFNARADSNASALAEKEGVKIYFYDVIYRALEEVRAALEGLLEPIFNEVLAGEVEVRQLFKSSNLGTIAGCQVTSGVVDKNNRVRILRNEEQIWEGGIISLRRFKDEVREVRSGLECGLRFRNFDAVEVGDVIQVLKIERMAQTL